MTVSAPLAITLAVRSAIASIEPRTSAIASWPTSGTIIGGCGAIPANTNVLASFMTTSNRTTAFCGGTRLFYHRMEGVSSLIQALHWDRGRPARKRPQLARDLQY